MRRAGLSASAELLVAICVNSCKQSIANSLCSSDLSILIFRECVSDLLWPACPVNDLFS